MNARSKLMSRSLTACAGAALLTAVAGPAAANLPAGGGLGEPFPVDCPALGGTVMVVSKDHSATAWTLDGAHVVVRSISGAGTGTDSAGNVFPIEFSKAYGTKRNLATLTCTAHLETSGHGFTSSVDITAVVAPVPPGA